MKLGKLSMESLDRSIQQAYECSKKDHYEGFDPYDGLNSGLFQSTFLKRIPFARLAWCQLFRRSLINLRPIMMVPKKFNPKGGALFLSAFTQLYQHTKDEGYAEDARKMYDLLINNCIARNKGLAFGYPFDWQSKAFFVPQGTPNLVTSVFVGNAFKKFHEVFKEGEAAWVVMGVSEFLMSEMVAWETDTELCFSYIPWDKTEVHNANLMAAAYLSEVYREERSPRLEEMIIKAVQFSIQDVTEDGYWAYGTRKHHRWMDNFHTGFNLEALLTIRKNLDTSQYNPLIRKVIKYYLDNLFQKNGMPKYYHNKVGPLDSHTLAESMIILCKILEISTGLLAEEDILRVRQCMDMVASYVVNKFQNKNGEFYYQKSGMLINKIPYIRWSQAWLFYALTCYKNSFQEINIKKKEIKDDGKSNPIFQSTH